VGRSVKPLLGEGLVSREIEVAVGDVVLVRAYLEASEGLGVLFAEHGGALTLAAPTSRAAELDQFVADLAEEMTVRLGLVAVAPEAAGAGSAGEQPDAIVSLEKGVSSATMPRR
jgi:hypothetical protein